MTAWRGFLEEAAPTEAGYMAPRKKNVLDAFVTKGMIRGAAEALMLQYLADGKTRKPN